MALAGKLADGTKLTRVCRNSVLTQNTAPSAPAGLTQVVNGGDVTFSWSAGSDAEGGAAGLTYNLRVGTTPGGNQILSGLASSSGYRRVTAQGNAGRRLSWTLHGITAGTLYWSVQSIDNCFLGSPWASEQQVVIDATPPTIVSAVLSPAMVRGGDPVQVTVDATDDVGVVSVTADSTALTHISGATWKGSITALPVTGSHCVTITARDAAGNQTPVSRCYTTVRAFVATTRSAKYVFPLYASSSVFTFWGRVAVTDAGNFTLDDGSGSPVKVIMPGFTGLSSGQFAVVRGTLKPTASPPTLSDATVLAVH